MFLLLHVTWSKACVTGLTDPGMFTFGHLKDIQTLNNGYSGIECHFFQGSGFGWVQYGTHFGKGPCGLLVSAFHDFRMRPCGLSFVHAFCCSAAPSVPTAALLLLLLLMLCCPAAAPLLLLLLLHYIIGLMSPCLHSWRSRDHLSCTLSTGNICRWDRLHHAGWINGSIVVMLLDLFQWCGEAKLTGHTGREEERTGFTGRSH